MASAAETSSKPAARVGLLGVDAASTATLTDCFRQFGIDALEVDTAAEAAEGCSGCVVPLTTRTAFVLRDLRQADPHTVIYGLCGSLREAVRFSEYGINAVFETPVQRQAALAVVRATHLLVLHELRKYVRVPLIAGVELETGGETVSATSMEISAGGMALSVRSHLEAPQSVVASFELPGAATVSVRAVLCWTRDSDSSAGIRFDPGDPHRAVVRRWVDEYLGA
jgi:hypothetical protein